MIPPVDRRIASGYGMRRIAGRDDYHTGLDFGAPAGTPVWAVAGGRVVVADPPGKIGGYGRVIVIRHEAAPAPIYSLYAHLSAAHVDRGAAVSQGQTIGAVGRTGGRRGEPDALIASPHLHFELLSKWPPSGIDEDRIDPAPYLTEDPRQIPSVRRQPDPLPMAATVGAPLLLIALAYQLLQKKTPRLAPWRLNLNAY